MTELKATRDARGGSVDELTELSDELGSYNKDKAFKQALIWLPQMTNEQIAQLSFECWHLAYCRSGQQIQDEVESVLGKEHE